MLGAVVEVSLHPPAGGVTRLHDAPPRRPDVLEAGQDLGVQSLVLEGQSGCGAHRIHVSLVVAKGGVVDQGADGLA